MPPIPHDAPRAFRLRIYRMFFRDHASFEQIAERLGCQVQTVRRVLVIEGGAKPLVGHGPYQKEDRQ